MMGIQKNNRTEVSLVSTESLVPKDHFLRSVESIIDFNFIEDKLRPLYCEDNGRPSIPPITLFKMIFIGYFYGIRSERQLEKEIQMNIAYRWFLGFSISDSVPDHSTISYNRHKRFQDSTIFNDIFDEIIEQARTFNMVGGRILATDSTHVKANANKRKFIQKKKEENPKDYIELLEEEVQKDRINNGKKPLKPRKEDDKPKTMRASVTDPDSGYLRREGKPEGFFFLDHRTVDTKYGIIVDTHITAGNVSDSDPYLSRLDYIQKHFNFNIEAVTLDAGYFTSSICKGLFDRDIYGVMSYRRTSTTSALPKRKFKYVEKKNVYVCPMGIMLKYSTTDREGYRHYKPTKEDCSHCPLKSLCTKSEKTLRSITRHIWEGHKETVRHNSRTLTGKNLRELRRTTIERSFADSKELNGYRYARYRGRSSVQEQAFLTATAQNIKKIAYYATKKVE